jgi:hypothetical protein
VRRETERGGPHHRTDCRLHDDALRTKLGIVADLPQDVAVLVLSLAVRHRDIDAHRPTHTKQRASEQIHAPGIGTLRASGGIHRYSKATGEMLPIATEQHLPRGAIADSECSYWTNSGFQASGGSVMRGPL